MIDMFIQVVDNSNNEVGKWDVSTGSQSVGPYSTGGSNPRGIAIDSTRLLVSTDGDDTVYVLDKSAGAQITNFGNSGKFVSFL